MITVQGLEQLGFEANVDFEIKDDGAGRVWVRKWNSNKPQPTEEDIEVAHAVWQAEHDSQEYARNRLEEYPSIEECVHAMLDDGLVELQKKRAIVKAKYPKAVS